MLGLPCIKGLPRTSYSTRITRSPLYPHCTLLKLRSRPSSLLTLLRFLASCGIPFRSIQLLQSSVMCVRLGKCFSRLQTLPAPPTSERLEELHDLRLGDGEWLIFTANVQTINNAVLMRSASCYEYGNVETRCNLIADAPNDEHIF